MQGWSGHKTLTLLSRSSFNTHWPDCSLQRGQKISQPHCRRIVKPLCLDWRVAIGRCDYPTSLPTRMFLCAWNEQTRITGSVAVRKFLWFKNTNSTQSGVSFFSAEGFLHGNIYNNIYIVYSRYVGGVWGGYLNCLIKSRKIWFN